MVGKPFFPSPFHPCWSQGGNAPCPSFDLALGSLGFDVPEAVHRIEADGYDGIVALENKHDPFMSLAVAAVNSQRLELATGVAIAFPRSPMIAANIGWDLQQASAGPIS